MSIRELQSRVVTRMLRLNQPDPSSSLSLSTSSSSSSSSSSPFDPLQSGGWKVLIYDQFGSDILSPLLSVSELRKLGITLHLLITAKRDAVRDTPAIYFVQPTRQNIDLILHDLSLHLYSAFHLHFTTSIPRPLLEHLAATSAQNGTSSRIARVYDEYVHFIALEEALLTLNTQRSFLTINDTRQSDDAMTTFIDSIVDSLFSIVVSLAVVPVIRASPDGAAALVAQRLDERLKGHLIQRQNLFTGSGMTGAGFQRPLLILLDRSVDLTAPLHHPWTYQALLNDLLGFSANRVSIVEDAPAGAAGPSAKGKVRSYDLSASEDKFWKANAGQPFPAVAAAVQDRVTALQEEQAKITKTTSGSSFDDPNSATSDLSSAISALPRVQRKKRLVETHTNIATALLKAIKQRDVDAFFEVEHSWISKASGDRTDLDRLIAQGKGTWRDRVRAALIFCLVSDASEADVQQLRSTLEKSIAEQKDGAVQAQGAAADLAALDYLTAYRFLHRLQSTHAGAAAPSSSASASAAGKADAAEGWGLFGKLANSISKEVVNQTAGVLAGVRNLLPTNTDLPVTRVVDSLLTKAESQEAERFLYFDPKQLKGKGGRARLTSGYRDVVVFMLGGGCYAEYQNVQEYAKRVQLNSLVYACTELDSPEAFMEQLVTLGQLQKASNKVPVD